jgi:hypothetical protein
MATTAATQPAEPTEKYTEPEYIGELRAVFAELRDHFERSEERRASGGDHEAQLALVWSNREIGILAERFESALFDIQAGESDVWSQFADAETELANLKESHRQEVAILTADKAGRRAAWLAYKAYRRQCESRRGFGERGLDGEDWRLTEAREAMFAAFDALEKG